ncbi:MAG TPA: AarF/UbiB family protein [Solirubrobacteraceae bacterium]|nr:AarF/UbiB family protein [Solirubrobacteraceae bacterium]
MSDDAVRRIDALIGVGMRLARSAPSGRVLLAVLGRVLEPAWIPQPWGDEIVAELGAARGAACEPIKLQRIERVLRAAWGVAPTAVLDELDPEPVATTPTSQVHRAVLEGRPVAVKVLRPGLAASVRQDLLLVERLLGPLAAAFPAIDASGLVAEFRERVLDELDLEHESMTQRRFHRALAHHSFLTVPAPVTRLAREDVLVSEWVDGVPLAQARDRDGAAARLLVFMVGAARFGTVPADPDPADVLLAPDGRLAVLDFGAARTVDRERVGVAAAALEAFARRDPDALARALNELRWLPADHGMLALDLIADALGDLARPGPARLDSDAVLAVRDRLFERPDALTELILAGGLPPEDLWPARGLLQLFGSIARIGATAPWLELTRAALRDGWSAEVRSPP